MGKSVRISAVSLSGVCVFLSLVAFLVIKVMGVCMCLSVAVSFAPARDKCKLRALRVCQRTTVKRGIKTHISRFVKVQEIVVKHLP